MRYNHTERGGYVIYVMSDLHGEAEKFELMLQKINFSEADELYILGDIFDRGPEPIKILLRIMDMPNVFPLLGNHELMGYDVLRRLSVEITQENFATQVDRNAMLDILEWQQNGGGVTMKQFAALPVEKRREVLEYIEDFYKFEAVDVGDKTFVLVHAGLGNHRADKKLSEYTLEELTMMTPDYEKRYFADESVFVVCGHTPTKAINGKWEIYHSHNNVCIDCGACFGGKLACLCLDTMEEFYV